MPRPLHTPPFTQDLKEFWRQHDVTILFALPLFDTQDHAFAVYGGWLESDSFRDTQSCSIACRQDGTMLPTFHSTEELDDFFGAENNWQCLGLFRSWDDVL